MQTWPIEKQCMCTVYATMQFTFFGASMYANIPVSQADKPQSCVCKNKSIFVSSFQIYVALYHMCTLHRPNPLYS